MSFSFSALGKSRTFLATALLFVIANAWSWLKQRLFPICCDQEITIGFPFPFHISGGLAGVENFYVLGLLLNIVLAFTLAVSAAWIAAAVKNMRQ